MRRQSRETDFKMEISGKASPHPEWKRLWAALRDALAAEQVWSYQELNEIGGIDIQHTARGRTQFHRFARECLDVLDLHFECMRMQGYRVVRANEHAGCSLARVRRAAKQTTNAVRIVTHVKYEQLTPAERALNANVVAHTSRLLQNLTSEGRVLRREQRGIQRGEPPPIPGT